MTATLETFMQLDERRARGGRHPSTPFWIEQAGRIYSHPTANMFVAEVGRGGIKSGFGTAVAENEVLFGDFDVPPGEVHYWVDISENKREAKQRLRQYEHDLQAFGIPFERRDDEIILPELRRGFLVRAADTGRVAGFRAIGGRVDECAKLRNKDGSRLEVGEVVTSLMAMMVTHVRHRPKCLLLSAPMGIDGYHAERVQAGNTEDQIVINAPTWVANPSISETDTHRLEPDVRKWSREYAAIPQAGAMAAFDSDAVFKAFRNVEPFVKQSPHVIVLDPSSGRKDTWSWARAWWEYPPIRVGESQPSGKSRLRFADVNGVAGAFFSNVSADEIVDRVAALARINNVVSVHADQREEFALASAFQRRGLTYCVHPWTAQSKPEAVERLRRWFAENRVILPEHEKLRRELIGFEERTTPSGSFTFGARGSGHDDYVALLITAVMAIGVNEDVLPQGYFRGVGALHGTSRDWSGGAGGISDGFGARSGRGWR